MKTERVFDGSHLRATAYGAATDKLIVTFRVYSRDISAFEPEKDRSAYVGRGFRHLHLTTRRSDWYLNADLPGALDAIGAFAEPFAHRVTLAFSMGGFGALMTSRVVDFDQVLLVSPHATFSPKYPPHDDRFRSTVREDAFAAAAFETIMDTPKSRADCVVLYDSSAPFDSAHADAACAMFHTARKVDLVGGGHPATRLLTNNRGFSKVMDAITGDRIEVGPILRHHAAFRAAKR